MASNTNKLKTVRKNKVRKAGKLRKRQIRSQGTTPAFAIHPNGLDAKKTAKNSGSKDLSE